MDFKKILLRYISSADYQPKRSVELADEFHLVGEERLELYELLDTMLANDELHVTKRGRYKPVDKDAEANHAKKSSKKEKSKKKAKQKAKSAATDAVEEQPSEQKAEQESKNTLQPDAAIPTSVKENSNAPKRGKGAKYVTPEVKLNKTQTVKKTDPQQTSENNEEQKEKPSSSQNESDNRPQNEAEKQAISLGGYADAEDKKEEGPVVKEHGFLKGNAKGFAFFVSDDKEFDDVFIAPDDLHGALHGDRVEIKITQNANAERGHNAEGEVVKILSRNENVIVGTFEKKGIDGYVIPDAKNYSVDIFVPGNLAIGANDGDKVVVEVDHKPGRGDYPKGKITEIIGNAKDSGVDITSIAYKFELPFEFSPETLKEAEEVPEEVNEDQKKGRKDFRKMFTVTIDGADAKDFDDAISIVKRGRFYNLFVHIADVANYVKAGSAIDKDAYLRGNSVYLLDRVIPMLPVELSNGLCSLNPHVDRLSMTTQMTIDENGTVVDYQFFESLIQSDYRLIYTDVSNYIEKGERFADDDELFEQLDQMNELYEILRKKRDARGSIDFEFPETDIVLNEEGVPVKIDLEERRTANRIIEEFMVLNNEVVGQHFSDRKLPFIYRVHEEPTPEKMERLNNALYAFHYDPVDAEDPKPLDFQRILKKAEGTPQSRILSMIVLTSMAKAVYRREPGIHFGLASERYSHFTSPIRRYADLIAHRLMKDFLHGDAMKGSPEVNKRLDEMCTHISETERKAEDAERDVVDMKSAEYMQKYVGEVLPGVVSSLTNFGVFIELENTIEGLAHFRNMQDDYYTYDEAHFVVRGERTNREIKYGDKVNVLVASSNPELREIDFLIQWDDGKTPAPKQTKNGNGFGTRGGNGVQNGNGGHANHPKGAQGNNRRQGNNNQNANRKSNNRKSATHKNVARKSASRKSSNRQNSGSHNNTSKGNTDQIDGHPRPKWQSHTNTRADGGYRTGSVGRMPNSRSKNSSNGKPKNWKGGKSGASTVRSVNAAPGYAKSSSKYKKGN